MPFTPFHMGPGTAIKAVTGRHFSLTIFGFAQVLIDIEPLVRMLHGDAVLHGFSHTYLGALLLAIITAGIGKPCCGWMLRSWNASARQARSTWACVHADISWRVAWVSALVGTFSHVWLDSFMHYDVRPWFPLSEANGLLALFPSSWIYVFCLMAGVIGLVILLLKFLWLRVLGDGED
ncbi:MAG: DUF4184 family protein [Thiothrix sp.]|uniref:DUF4184 family protein n=1 Tax=Thiothrix sp. TaxID=1032 RepID=UPI0026352AE9|nr:DUF4184 family protein [Thiothrix sp.]MDD5391468.1 DUF4184 family protein [Thiothrix sp.]